jgi:hypothetical protein
MFVRFTVKGAFMSYNENVVNLTLEIGSQEVVDGDELDQITRLLMSDLEELPVESVIPLRSQTVQLGAKNPDVITWGALAVVAVQATLPKLLEFMQAWTLRNQGHTVKIKAQRGDRSIEIEYPQEMKPEEVRKQIKTIMDTLGKDSKTH